MGAGIKREREDEPVSLALSLSNDVGGLGRRRDGAHGGQDEGAPREGGGHVWGGGLRV